MTEIGENPEKKQQVELLYFLPTPLAHRLSIVLPPAYYTDFSMVFGKAASFVYINIFLTLYSLAPVIS